MWELAQAHQGNPAMVERYLREGYEPFAVSTDSHSFPIIWLKREVVDTEANKLAIECYAKLIEVLKNEVCGQQSKPAKRTSRGTAKKTKG